MKDDKITYVLDTNIPMTLSAQYRGRIKRIGLAIVPEVMQSDRDGIPLSLEEEILMAIRYLKAVLS